MISSPWPIEALEEENRRVMMWRTGMSRRKEHREKCMCQRSWIGQKEMLRQEEEEEEDDGA